VSSDKAYEAAGVPDLSALGRRRKRGRVWAARLAVRAYKVVEDLGAVSGRDQSAEALQVIEEALQRRHYSLRATRFPLSKSFNRADGLPELRTFQKRWGLRFPIPCAVGNPWEELMTDPWTRPVRILSGTKQSLRLRIYTKPGKDLVLAFVCGALSHYNPKRQHGDRMKYHTVSRKRGVKHIVRVVRVGVGSLEATIELPANREEVCKKIGKRLLPSAAHWRSLDHYKEVFRAFDLRKKGHRRAVIARRVLRHGSRGALQVRDRERTFANLVTRFGLPTK